MNKDINQPFIYVKSEEEANILKKAGFVLLNHSESSDLWCFVATSNSVACFKELPVKAVFSNTLTF